MPDVIGTLFHKEIPYGGVKGDKGNTGATPNVSATASVDSTTGTPSVNVIKTGTVENPSFEFKFSNLKGEKGDPGSGGGHTMAPTPAAGLTEAQVVSAVNAASGTNEEVPSLFGIQKWSNQKTFRAVLLGSSGAIGHYGIGEWQWQFDNPTAADESSWGWWQNDIFKYLGDLSVNGYNVDFKIKYDPSAGEPITLGGYQIDTDTGYMCIRFANYVIDPTNAKVFVDVTFTRNDIVLV